MTLGKYTVVIAIRQDNPAFPCYRVFVGERLIGKQFSVPSISDCQWLERQQVVGRLVYASRSARLWEYSVQSFGCPRRKKRAELVEEEEPT